MTIVTVAIVLAAIEILLLRGKRAANKNTAEREGEREFQPSLCTV